jgi:RNA polymerase sigma-70 factor (ECF subfamily)
METPLELTIPSEWSEAILIDLCLAGESRALREFVVRFQALILGVSQRILSHRQDAEDVTQETLVRALRGLSRFDQQRPLQPWILRIAVNRCRTALSLRRTQAMEDRVVNQLADERSRPDQELAEELELALASLREQYRISFVLYHHQQLSLPEIAEIWNCPVGTVKTWLHRARRQLALRLAERGLGPRESRSSQTELTADSPTKLLPSAGPEADLRSRSSHDAPTLPGELR